MSRLRLAVDIGGTFTDIVLAGEAQWHTHKLLTTHTNPASAVLEGVRHILALAKVKSSSVAVVLHGTTLATNALIERKGARTVLITTEGHRDVLEIGLENRFDQYDVFMRRPAPLVPRERRITVRERISATGGVLLPLTSAEVERVIDAAIHCQAESVAVGLLHAWRSPRHEEAIAAALRSRVPTMPISLSSEVCPEIREYERLSTTVANAFVQPLMAAYLNELQAGLRETGIAGPLLVMTSGGGLTSLEAAATFPVRLIESGPAGGAMLAAALARRSELSRVLAFDMGGTTAKLTLIDDGEPEWSRTFEVARAWKFRKGSGMPVRIPVIELVEIGAGGGSIAQVDRLGRIQVGPESAGSEPGPAAYHRGGVEPTVTDADVVLGRLSPERFAGGSITLAPDQSTHVIEARLGRPLGVDARTAAQGIIDTVDEHMAAAARNHAGEWGRDLTGRTLIAFGGSAPLHAVDLAIRLGINTAIIPVSAGVGSAVGFLLSPTAFEVVRSRHVLVDEADQAGLLELFERMRAEALDVVRPLVGDGRLRETRRAWMRYVGQGHEIPVTIPDGVDNLSVSLTAAFLAAYAAIYGRVIPGQSIEALSWTLALVGETPVIPDVSMSAAAHPASGSGLRKPVTGVVERSAVGRSHPLEGPILVVEDQTTTVVPQGWQVTADEFGQLVLMANAGRKT